MCGADFKTIVLSQESEAPIRGARVPGADAKRFEAAMKQAVPELFESQSDLLFQLVTLLPPNRLKKAGFNVYALDQRAGQFIFTFPQAYHAGFNAFSCCRCFTDGQRDSADEGAGIILIQTNSTEDIAFDCPEIDTLAHRSQDTADFQRDAKAALVTTISRPT